jgi:fermentation-respiration switch protein FrsA (DUF1100 family)
MSAVRVAFNSFPTLPLTDIMVNISKVHKFMCPTLVMHGIQDEVINVNHGETLAQRIRPEYLHELVLVDGAGHNDMEFGHFELMTKKVDSLIVRVVAPPPPTADIDTTLQPMSSWMSSRVDD